VSELLDINRDPISKEELREQSLHQLGVLGQATPDEVAAALARSVLAVRPRFTELKIDGLVRETGERRKNRSGRTAAVLELAG
jgi:predicted ArsR family transcriptional regulator